MNSTSTNMREIIRAHKLPSKPSPYLQALLWNIPFFRESAPSKIPNPFEPVVLGFRVFSNRVGNLTQIPPISCFQLEYFSVLDLDIVLVTKHNIAHHLQIMESEAHLHMMTFGCWSRHFILYLLVAQKSFYGQLYFLIGQSQKLWELF